MNDKVYDLEKVGLLLRNENVRRRFSEYTHADAALRLAEALTDSGYDLDELSQGNFNKVLDVLEYVESNWQRRGR